MLLKSHPYTTFLSLFALLLWLASLAAEETLEQGLLFEVRSEAGKRSHLFGTIHSENDRVMELPAQVEDAFDSARSFVMEVVPDADAILRSMVTMVFTDGRTLEGVVGPDRFQEIVAAMKSRGMAEEAIEDFKPWAIVTILSLPPAETGEFLDMHLYKSALSAGKPVIGLETMDEQLAVLDELSESDQVTLLSEILEVLDELPAVHERLLAAYLQRDLAELARLGGEYLRAGDSEVGGRFKAAALDVRNERMTERVIPLLEQGGHFVALGALHLPGDDGILARLKAFGFEVRRIY
jgi:uncharacterized protein YbaP (TraB family)